MVVGDVIPEGSVAIEVPRGIAIDRRDNAYSGLLGGLGI
jgi:hypothetical protein